jgi:hypothetical protein
MNAGGNNENDSPEQGGDGNGVQPQETAPRGARHRAPQDTKAGRPAASGGLLPNKAAEDDPRRWGDQPGSYDHDAWLKEQRPPHWG